MSSSGCPSGTFSVIATPLRDGVGAKFRADATRFDTADQAGIDVRDEMAEAIDPGHARLDAFAANNGRHSFELHGRSFEAFSQFAQRQAVQQMGGRRGHYVASMKRRCDFAASIRCIGDLHDVGITVPLQHERQQTVIGRDVELASRGNREDRPIRTHARIDDGDMHGAGRKRLREIGDEKRGTTDVLRRNLMRDVDDRGLRRETEDHAFHLGDVMVGPSEVGGQRDGGKRCRHAGSCRSRSVNGRERAKDVKAVIDPSFYGP